MEKEVVQEAVLHSHQLEKRKQMCLVLRTRIVELLDVVELQYEKNPLTSDGIIKLSKLTFVENEHHLMLHSRTSSTSGSNATSSSSESDDEYQKSRARRKPETITIVKQPSQLYHKTSLPIRPVQKQQPIQRQNNRKRDRFYDKSQDIPNAIYFGDVDVPLHVLHAYGDSDSDNDTGIKSNVKIGNAKFDSSKSSQIRFSSQVSKSKARDRTIALPNQLGKSHSDTRHQQKMKTVSDNQKARGRPKVSNSVSPSSDPSIQMMKTFLKAAGLKKVKLNRLWEGKK